MTPSQGIAVAPAQAPGLNQGANSDRAAARADFGAEYENLRIAAGNLRGMLPDSLKGRDFKTLVPGVPEDLKIIEDALGPDKKAAAPHILRALNFYGDGRFDPRDPKKAPYFAAATTEMRMAVNMLAGREVYPNLPANITAKALQNKSLRYNLWGTASRPSTPLVSEAPVAPPPAPAQPAPAPAAPTPGLAPVRPVSSGLDRTRVQTEGDGFDNDLAYYMQAGEFHRFAPAENHAPGSVIAEAAPIQQRMQAQIDAALRTMESRNMEEAAGICPEASNAIKGYRADLKAAYDALGNAGVEYDRVSREYYKAHLQFLLKLSQESGQLSGNKEATDWITAEITKLTQSKSIVTPPSGNTNVLENLIIEAEKRYGVRLQGFKDRLAKEEPEFRKTWNGKMDTALGNVYQARMDLYALVDPRADPEGNVVDSGLYEKIRENLYEISKTNKKMARWLEDGAIISDAQEAFVALPSTQAYLAQRERTLDFLAQHRAEMSPALQKAFDEGTAVPDNFKPANNKEKAFADLINMFNKKETWRAVIIGANGRPTDSAFEVPTKMSRFEFITLGFDADLRHRISQDRSGRVTLDTDRITDGSFDQRGGFKPLKLLAEIVTLTLADTEPFSKSYYGPGELASQDPRHPQRLDRALASGNVEAVSAVWRDEYTLVSIDGRKASGWQKATSALKDVVLGSLVGFAVGGLFSTSKKVTIGDGGGGNTGGDPNTW